MVRELKDMPQEGRFEQGKIDPTTGIGWVYVTREMAHAHPLGRLGLILYLIVAYFVLSSGLKVALVLQGAGLGVLLAGAIQLATAFGLYFRVPWAIILAAFQVGLAVVFLVSSLTTTADLFGLAEAIVSILILFYLMDGERPNLIYRYRYRSHKGSET